MHMITLHGSYFSCIIATFSHIICVILVWLNANMIACHKWPTKTKIFFNRTHPKHKRNTTSALMNLFVWFCRQFSFYKCLSYTNIFSQSMFISISLHLLLIAQFSWEWAIWERRQEEERETCRQKCKTRDWMCITGSY